MLSAKQAAESIGLTKAGLLKAVKSGRVSATRNIKGEWEFDASELYRVYPPKLKEVPEVPPEQKDAPESITERLELEIKLLRERLADKEDVIHDLRQRLDKESEERRAVTRLLTDNQHKESWWRKLLG
jgi:hypothetical protein